jgi:hypothetical protein
MIAQVWKTAGSPPTTEDDLKSGQATIERLRAVDGCEGMHALVDLATGDGLAIAFWRDESAMKAADRALAAEMDEAKTTTPTTTVTPAGVYEVVASA